jgi:two-component system sensor histidine kinase/response regulator
MSARLLIVDDEGAHLKALCNTLRMDGFETTGFESPAAALQGLQRGDFELLLTDLLMPEIGGIDFMRAAREIDPDLAGVIMTGHGTIDTAVAAIQGGAFDYIQKPFKLSALLPILGRALEARRMRIEHTELQQRERRQAVELAAAYRDLESFAYSVSHDLRAPLRAVDGFCRLYVDEFGEGVPPRGRELLDQVLLGTARMERLISDLLMFSRYSSQPLHTVEVDLEALVRRVLAGLEGSGLKGNVEFVIGALPHCAGDPALLEQVFINLLSNALKFSRHRSPARIEVGSHVQPAPDEGGLECVFSVRDNGAGFDPKYAHKLFAVFQRLHSEREFEGTGVGLSIVQRIVQRHGGRIWATGAPEEGATFYFTLKPWP